MPLRRSWEAGLETWRRYSALVSPEKQPFVRASSAERVVQSATNWTAGDISVNGCCRGADEFVTGFAYGSDYAYYPPLSVVLSEAV